MTDVTGFGLLGHLHELAGQRRGGRGAKPSAVPAIAGVLELLRSDEPPVAGGTPPQPRLGGALRGRGRTDVPEELRWLLCDAMTSGGLLVAAAPGAGAARRQDRTPRWRARPARIAVSA